MPRNAIFLLAPVIALLIACVGGDKESRPSANAPDVNELLQRAGTATKSAQSFHFNFTQEAGATMPMPLSFRLVSAEGDYQAPDRMKAGVRARASGANVSVEIIGVGERTWITNPFTRRWQDLPGTTAADIADPTAIVGVLLSGLKDPKLTGEAEVDGVKTYRVTGTIDSSMLRNAFSTVEAGYTNNVDLWLGADDALPRRARIAGPLYKDDPQNVSRQVELSKYGSSVDIKAPA